MKIQLDFTHKTITIPDDVNLGELITNLSKIFPEERWRSWTLLSNSPVFPWTNPIYIPSQSPSALPGQIWNPLSQQYDWNIISSGQTPVNIEITTNQ